MPFLGICLGMQLAIIEFARNVLGIKQADSSEFNPNCKEPFIYLIEDFIDQQGISQIRTHTSPMGGTMRLGEYECNLKPNTNLAKAYNNAKTIKERHRHRAMLESSGLIISGESKNGLIEAVELQTHPFFVAVQFHPEFTSHLQAPNPIILDFVKKSLESSR